MSASKEADEARATLLAQTQHEPPPAYNETPHTVQEMHDVLITKQPARYVYDPATALPKPQSYFVLALVATVCCCNLIGAIGVVYSFLAERHYYEGRHDKARSSSRKALVWSIVSIVVGILLIIALIVLQMFARSFFAQYKNHHYHG